MDDANHGLVALGLLASFTLSMKELAEWFDVELARMVVDQCLGS